LFFDQYLFERIQQINNLTAQCNAILKIGLNLLYVSAFQCVFFDLLVQCVMCSAKPVTIGSSLGSEARSPSELYPDNLTRWQPSD